MSVVETAVKATVGRGRGDVDPSTAGVILPMPLGAGRRIADDGNPGHREIGILRIDVVEVGAKQMGDRVARRRWIDEKRIGNRIGLPRILVHRRQRGAARGRRRVVQSADSDADRTAGRQGRRRTGAVIAEVTEHH